MSKPINWDDYIEIPLASSIKQQLIKFIGSEQQQDFLRRKGERVARDSPRRIRRGKKEHRFVS